jgi:hypothetical protein
MTPASVCLLVLWRAGYKTWQRNSPKQLPGYQNAQLDFERAKELKMRTFLADFMKDYNSTGLPSADICGMTFGRLGAFLHLKERPQIEFPVDCLVGRYALPVIYYVAGWTLYSMSKASTIAADKRALYFMFAALQ